MLLVLKTYCLIQHILSKICLVPKYKNKTEQNKQKYLHS